MSRLYSILEKIRANEQGRGRPHQFASVSGGLTQAGNGKRLFIALCLTGAVAASLLTFGLPPKSKRLPSASTSRTFTDGGSPTGTRATLQTPAPVSQPSATSGEDPYQQLNDTGVTLALNNEPWRGLYFLDLARQQQPQRPEALINMAVILAELGLHTPSLRFFDQARSLAPEHPLLRKNMEILERAGFL